MKHNPFEYNQINQYLWNKQGKRHYWGIRGKDYGFLQSPTFRNSTEDQHLRQLKQHHAQYSLSPYEEKQTLRLSDDPTRRSDMRIQDNSHMRNRFISQQNSPQQYKLRTQPVEYQEERQESSRQGYKKHLSLMSRNIQIKNQVPVESKRFSTIEPTDRGKEMQYKYHKRVSTQGDIDKMNNEMNKYRERIVKVVKRDRKNNPTFCNSLAYPLHCHRYVE